MKFVPNYDKGFKPMIVALREFNQAVMASAHKTLSICVERNCGYNYIYNLEIFDTDDKALAEENYRVAERIIKSILWIAGGYKIYLCGDKYVYNAINDDYSATGARAFDFNFMANVYETPFEVVWVENKKEA